MERHHPGGPVAPRPDPPIDEEPMTEHHEHHHEHHEHRPIDYGDAVRQYRADKDAFFKTERSPIPAAERASFAGLPYYEVDPGLRFDGVVLEPYTGNEPVRFEIPTSDGRLKPAERAGVFRIPLAGGERQLTAYAFEGDPDRETLFVPFLDATSGKETYGAGRYLDVAPIDETGWSLDFNFAYHPSCVYDPRFSCPLTPAENRLPDRIEAGERLSEAHG
jgi:uncharacterized protein (DUF1684 family)